LVPHLVASKNGRRASVLDIREGSNPSFVANTFVPDFDMGSIISTGCVSGEANFDVLNGTVCALSCALVSLCPPLTQYLRSSARLRERFLSSTLYRYCASADIGQLEQLRIILPMGFSSQSSTAAPRQGHISVHLCRIMKGNMLESYTA
jgi:hypothetical protein